jgi:hypothetical protein
MAVAHGGWAVLRRGSAASSGDPVLSAVLYRGDDDLPCYINPVVSAFFFENF